MTFFTFKKIVYEQVHIICLWSAVAILTHHCPGACPGFLKGGSNISWFPKKRSSDFKRGGSNGLKGGVQYICLTMTTNLAHLDAKE